LQFASLPQRTTTAVVYGAVVLIAVFAPPIVFGALLAVAGVLGLRELVALRSAGVAVFAELAVLAVGLASLYFLRVLGEPPFVLTVTILAIWAADIVAYLVGSAVGRRKIVPSVSPGKTWEGTFAGFAAAAVVVVLAATRGFGEVFAITTAASIGPSAFAGDLLESWVKRRAGVKDSGALFPGHGGMLDRIDSLLAAAPVVALLLVLTRRMG
jgi:phosphatidate cytidylyltransferase